MGMETSHLHAKKPTWFLIEWAFIALLRAGMCLGDKKLWL